MSGIRVEAKIPLLLVHTPFGLAFFDRAAKWRVSKAYAKVNAYMMPAITALAIFLIIGSLTIMATSPATRGAVASAGPSANILIPGLNPYLPIVYGWAALIITIIIHEGGHGVIARVYGAKVDSTGIVLLLFIPVGAFVNISREELNKLSLKQKSAVLTAGPLNNMVLAAVSLAAMMFIVYTLIPIPNVDDTLLGVSVIRITEGMPADQIGITAGSTIQYVNGIQVTSLQQFGGLIQNSSGQTMTITWTDPDRNTITRDVAISSENPRIGVEVTMRLSPDRVLNTYKTANPLGLLLPPTLQPASVPYSDMMASQYRSDIFGDAYAPLANMLFWFWFINFNVGIFNALPIGPLDGGQLYGAVVESRVKAKAIARNANLVLSLIMVGVVIATLGLPYVI